MLSRHRNCPGRRNDSPSPKSPPSWALQGEDVIPYGHYKAKLNHQLGQEPASRRAS